MIMNEDGFPLEKYEREEASPLYPIYCYIDNELSGTAELNTLIGNMYGFDTVKLVQLTQYFLQTFTDKDGLIMVFSGSATTANAFTMSPKIWIENTNAFGIISKAGRYAKCCFVWKDS